MQLLFSKRLRRFSRLYTRVIVRELPELPNECFIEVLQILSDTANAITQKELADILQVDKSRIATMVDDLISLGYIFTEKNPVDRRAHFVFLTEKGSAFIPVVKTVISKVNSMLCHELNPELLDTFNSTLSKMEQNLNQSLS
jgi:DNA-binding MarR family transcriptional regulator